MQRFAFNHGLETSFKGSPSLARPRQRRSPCRWTVASASGHTGSIQDVQAVVEVADCPTEEGLTRRGLLKGTLMAVAGVSVTTSEQAAAVTSTSGSPAVCTAPAAILEPAAPRPPLRELSGVQALRDPAINRGLATSAEDRARYGLRGLLPPGSCSLEVEVRRASQAVARAQGSPLVQYQLLMGLRERQRDVFYALVQQDLPRYLPLIYTPTVGDACLSWGTLSPRPSCLYVSLEDRGRVAEVVAAWPEDQVRICVITDGERILGLGDLGAHGAGIPAGKAAVYGACGVDPRWILPVMLDVGTDRMGLLEDPFYCGLRMPRERGDAYYSLMDETVAALKARYGPSTVIHFEDVGASHAFPLLDRLSRMQGATAFNDDIQCTAAVTLAALLGAEWLAGVVPLERQRFLFFGAGQANLGCADLLCYALESRGLTRQQAADAVWLMDSKGLVTKDRKDLSDSKRRFARDAPLGSVPTSLEGVVRAVRPTALIGAAAVGGAFSPRVLAALTEVQPSASSRPIVFALSNPTSKAECTFKHALDGTGGRAVFASGTEFPVEVLPNGLRLRPAQANNCFVFPGIGQGTVLSGASSVTNAMLLASAQAVAGMLTPVDLEEESVLPPVSKLGRAAAEVTTAVIKAAAAASTA